MIDGEELAALAADLESFRVERKAAFKSVKSDVEAAICAFANDLPGTGLPGYVLLGVTDKTGEPAGLAVTDELMREITDIRWRAKHAVKTETQSPSSCSVRGALA